MQPPRGVDNAPGGIAGANVNLMFDAPELLFSDLLRVRL